jgi:hypothetical protein
LRERLRAAQSQPDRERESDDATDHTVNLVSTTAIFAQRSAPVSCVEVQRSPA